VSRVAAAFAALHAKHPGRGVAMYPGDQRALYADGYGRVRPVIVTNGGGGRGGHHTAELFAVIDADPNSPYGMMVPRAAVTLEP
jgi:hypothetical protein